MSEAASSKFIRSPSYPSLSLKDAVDAVGKIERQYRSSAVDRTQAAKLVGYSSLSGPANKALAALASFGLLERAGKGETRVTSRARAILHANNEQERIDNLLAAASEPDLFRELMERFDGIPVPPLDGVLTYLNRQGFNPTAVRPAARAFLDTMSFVEELRGSDSHDYEQQNGAAFDASDDENDAIVFGGAKVGDLIQWESNGMLQLAKPLRVRAVSEDGKWVAVDGSETGIPMNEVIVETAASGEQKAPRFPFPQEDQVLPPAKNEIEWMRNRLGQSTNVRLLVQGAMGPREIGRLIKLLQAQKSVLEEDDADDDAQMKKDYP
ncbi:MAG: hypothetical protein E5W00_01430 [Mesorhizobium sp.]|nr:MAG: hypothetical protein E5W00_01430 [Mesorhizobium sp.]TIX05621.1 MAG: hypothetical protein E5V57_09605 [Mesorhizobium sp.]